MQEIILDTIFDCLKILPFLFIAFLIIEFLDFIKIDDELKENVSN